MSLNNVSVIFAACYVLHNLCERNRDEYDDSGMKQPQNWKEKHHNLTLVVVTKSHKNAPVRRSGER